MSTHRWFRIDEVLPIAEHAMASPEQHITRAQVLAGAAQRPALIWTSTGEEDLVSSNGVPIWYDIDGGVHAAAAHTWRPTAAGPRGGTARPDRRSAYLPLEGARDRPPVIDALRDGWHTGRHWVVIDIDPTGGHLIRRGWSPTWPGCTPTPTRKPTRCPASSWCCASTGMCWSCPSSTTTAPRLGWSRSTGCIRRRGLLQRRRLPVALAVHQSNRVLSVRRGRR